MINNHILLWNFWFVKKRVETPYFVLMISHNPWEILNFSRSCQRKVLSIFFRRTPKIQTTVGHVEKNSRKSRKSGLKQRHLDYYIRKRNITPFQVQTSVNNYTQKVFQLFWGDCPIPTFDIRWQTQSGWPRIIAILPSIRWSNPSNAITSVCVRQLWMSGQASNYRTCLWN